MNITNVYDTIIITLYTLGLIFWLVIWYITDSFSLVKKNRLIYFPLLLIPVVFTLEVLFFLWDPVVGTFQVEEAMVVVVERTNRQLITATFGMIVLAATLLNFNIIKNIKIEFLSFVSFSLLCSVGGVLVLFWPPTNNPTTYFILRHFKTVPYTYSIGFFLTGLLMLLQEIVRAEKGKK